MIRRATRFKPHGHIGNRAGLPPRLAFPAQAARRFFSQGEDPALQDPQGDALSSELKWHREGISDIRADIKDMRREMTAEFRAMRAGLSSLEARMTSMEACMSISTIILSIAGLLVGTGLWTLARDFTRSTEIGVNKPKDA
ncbi:hypothetical protein TWF696_007606 [Orbilia brochopaga]|uniref:Uncharacterized protein n=1 Tax=Orbilia brochopaga TaxID=3140254 RepID=A0AAV9UQ47_9PEZI